MRAARLKTWKATLQSTVEDTMPAFLRLEDESRNLQVELTACPLCAPYHMALNLLTVDMVAMKRHKHVDA